MLLQEASAVPLRSRLQIPDLHLVEHLANNKGAAVAASVAGAAAGGALAGPFGIAAGQEGLLHNPICPQFIVPRTALASAALLS